jgi:chromosomal replication initiation ATPase DnaA
MYSREMFIKSISKDDEERILIAVQNHFAPQLKEDQVKSEIKKMLSEVIGEDFSQLEIGKNMLRVTVENNADENIVKINNYIDQMIQMAGQFMENMDDKEESN